ncbi:MAG: hypothetical protein OEN01_02355 [Candidatus Krumholzibacteria bacterium]|nr:hypothetical protein [Candidatus Krumholzibacteria bacterium]
MMQREMPRKEFLQELVSLLVFAGAGAGLLASCGKTEESAQTARTDLGDAKGTQKTSKTTASDRCTDVSGLTAADVKMRNETLKYVAGFGQAV